ncbi:hypothetical protein RSOLAG1IB_12288 [Rhizoctonia solani AG-1 IB]|uniref:Uncharacterized protein n=1 Tax=Thanatephorus cucumeris (strain AG1-IB / isolate 7/3/14) TaxID=1108050 RepID=A0A0B7FUW8_THACB|nr:hypothetical protein RSOLAG1IB_12288 [Rhizoctonia solani AG-1 IB]
MIDHDDGDKCWAGKGEQHQTPESRANFIYPFAIPPSTTQLGDFGNSARQPGQDSDDPSVRFSGCLYDAD